MKHGGEVIRERLWEICNRVWRGEGWPEDWSEGIVVPVVKKGEGEKVDEYRGVPLTQTAYKVYAAVLAERLRKEIAKKGGKMLVLFVDMKAAFDTVDREVLAGSMRKAGVREGLVERCVEVLRETRSKVRVEKKEGKSFWTVKGVRQGCPLSPILFTMLIADMEELKKATIKDAWKCPDCIEEHFHITQNDWWWIYRGILREIQQRW
ncbi:uncharacterized protein LOC143219998 [Lasioglossum baleicum]|uniref:uncharacterized protein LOC143219998 n=1 Tax=Lasioglossum baleicum TaxID=434251 RepID=UPI003FCCA8B3